MSDFVKKASAVGGLITVVATVLGGGWQIFSMLRDGREAYAQVQDLRESVRSVERRLDSTIARQWKIYKMNEAAKEAQGEDMADPEAQPPPSQPDGEPDPASGDTDPDPAP